MKAMGLSADVIACSTQPEINALKPLPAGLKYVLSQFRLIDKSSCLFIGDRFELDGICAQNAGLPFLLFDKEMAADFYPELCRQMDHIQHHK